MDNHVARGNRKRAVQQEIADLGEQIGTAIAAKVGSGDDRGRGGGQIGFAGVLDIVGRAPATESENIHFDRPGIGICAHPRKGAIDGDGRMSSAAWLGKGYEVT